MRSELEKHVLKVKLGVIHNVLKEAVVRAKSTLIISLDDAETLKEALEYIDELEKQINLLNAGLEVQRDLTGKYANEIWKLKEVLGENGTKIVNSSHKIKTTVTKEDIDNILANTIIKTEKYGDKTIVLKATLPNGFVIVESSSCVDPINFDMATGEKICMEHLENKLWELEGYRLQTNRDRCCL